MTESFPVSGHAVLASSGRSVKLQLVNRNGADYVSVKDLEALIKGKKKTVQVWRPNHYPYKPKYRR